MFVGTIWAEDGKLYNSVALLDGGRIEAVRHKVDLPNYGVFDEKRVFDQAGKYPVWLIGWNCDWLGIDNFLYTAFFGYRGDPLAPNPEYALQERRDEPGRWSTRWRPPIRPPSRPKWSEAQDFIAADLPVSADRVGQDRWCVLRPT